MTTKKYLTTPEEILALKDTDTVIHYGADGNFVMKFVQGVLCLFSKEDNRLICFNEPLSPISQNPYILIEEPSNEATEKDIGYLCYFYEDDDIMFLGILDDIDEEGQYSRRSGSKWTHCRRLTPAEVAEITGYKVEALR